MATINYKEKYEKAVHAAMLAKQDTESAVTIRILEEIFPELKESEDERIRKEIIAHIKWCEDGGYCAKEEMTRWISWLEKQKTSEEALQYLRENHSPSEMSDFQAAMNIAVAKAYDKGYNDGLENQGETSHILSNSSNIGKDDQKLADKVEPKFNIGDKIIGIISGIQYYITKVCDNCYYTESGCIIMFCAQDNFELYKQKPAWSEEDEKLRIQCLDLITNFPSPNGKIDWTGCQNWLKSLKDKVQPQPQQKWSEEDEEHIKSLLERLEGMCKKGATFTMTRFAVSEDEDWLKHLKDRVQPKQEWSEEDEKMINKLLAVVKLYYDRDGDDLDKQSCISWLKFLKDRYTWKPSEKQMVALKHAFNDGSIDFADMKILGTLYEQLKALHRYEQDT